MHPCLLVFASHWFVCLCLNNALRVVNLSRNVSCSTTVWCDMIWWRGSKLFSVLPNTRLIQRCLVCLFTTSSLEHTSRVFTHHSKGFFPHMIRRHTLSSALYILLFPCQEILLSPEHYGSKPVCFACNRDSSLGFVTQLCKQEVLK